MDAGADTSRPASPLRAMAACYGVALRRMVFTRLMMANGMLALLPVAVALLIAFAMRRPASAGFAHLMYEGFLHTLYLNFVVFFSANVVGFSIMRQDAEEQTLHYLLLQPISRWAVAAARLLAFLTLTTLICCLSFWMMYVIFALKEARAIGNAAELFGLARLLILGRESGVLALGLLIYGSIAMMMTSFNKTALYALVLWGWETALPYLPSTLKEFTATYYLHSLLPEPPGPHNRLFEMLGDMATPGASLAVLLTASLLFFLIAGWFFQRRQCLYGET